MKHDNNQLPHAFHLSFKSIPPSIRCNYGHCHSITFMRHSDRLTESINQQPLEKSTPYPYTVQHIFTQRQTQAIATKARLLLLIYYCVPPD